jgi:hypothetical protein
MEMPLPLSGVVIFLFANSLAGGPSSKSHREEQKGREEEILLVFPRAGFLEQSGGPARLESRGGERRGGGKRPVGGLSKESSLEAEGRGDWPSAEVWEEARAVGQSQRRKEGRVTHVAHRRS